MRGGVSGATKNMSSLISVSPIPHMHASRSVSARACATLSRKGEGRRRTRPVFGLQRNRRRPGNPPLAVPAPSRALDGGGDASFHSTPMTRRQLVTTGGRGREGRHHRGLLEFFAAAASLGEETGTELRRTFRFRRKSRPVKSLSSSPAEGIYESGLHLRMHERFAGVEVLTAKWRWELGRERRPTCESACACPPAADCSHEAVIERGIPTMWKLRYSAQQVPCPLTSLSVKCPNN